MGRGRRCSDDEEVVYMSINSSKMTLSSMYHKHTLIRTDTEKGAGEHTASDDFFYACMSCTRGQSEKQCSLRTLLNDIPSALDTFVAFNFQ